MADQRLSNVRESVTSMQISILWPLLHIFKQKRQTFIPLVLCPCTLDVFAALQPLNGPDRLEALVCTTKEHQSHNKDCWQTTLRTQVVDHPFLFELPSNKEATAPSLSQLAWLKRLLLELTRHGCHRDLQFWFLVQNSAFHRTLQRRQCEQLLWSYLEYVKEQSDLSCTNFYKTAMCKAFSSAKQICWEETIHSIHCLCWNCPYLLCQLILLLGGNKSSVYKMSRDPRRKETDLKHRVRIILHITRAAIRQYSQDVCEVSLWAKTFNKVNSVPRWKVEWGIREASLQSKSIIAVHEGLWETSCFSNPYKGTLHRKLRVDAFNWIPFNSLHFFASQKWKTFQLQKITRQINIPANGVIV